VSLHEEENYKEALKLYEEALKSAPNYSLVWYNRGGILFKLNRLKQYSGQFLKRDAMPSASNAYAIQQRSEKSECNLNPK
jgi:tetratricopeptide (TPR) repeat protein